MCFDFLYKFCLKHFPFQEDTVITVQKSSSKVKVKLKWSRYRPGVAQRVGRGIALLFLGPRHSRLGGGSAPIPGRTLPPGKTRYPFYRRLGEPQGRSERAENLVSNGIRSRSVQPVVSFYTDWATRLYKWELYDLQNLLQHCVIRPIRKYYNEIKKVNVKVIPLHALCGPEGG